MDDGLRAACADHDCSRVWHHILLPSGECFLSQRLDHSAGGRGRVHQPACATHVRLACVCRPHAMPPRHDSISQSNSDDPRFTPASTVPLRSARRSTAESARHGWDSRTKVAAAASASVRIKGHACRCELCTSFDRHTLCAGYKRWLQ